MKLFRVLVLAVALVAGGVAAYLALNLGPEGAPAPTVVEIAPQIQSQDVLVAAADITQGQKLSAENVRWQRWPDDAMNPSYIQKQAQPDAIEKLKGSIVRSTFVAGEPIRDVKLARAESGFLSAILPAGKRAIAVNVSARNTAGGFILPNDRVDVVLTIAQQTNANAPAENVSRTILSNVKVLAIDQTVEEQSGESVVVGKTATLELDPAQVELITSAEASGTLSLALRSVADSDEAVVARQEERERQSNTVRIIRSGRSQTVTTQ
jgi:pilus assembly protein CpaB